MINALALALVLSSLAAAGVWSPAQTENKPVAAAGVVKEGHRLLVVEYQRLVPDHATVAAAGRDRAAASIHKVGLTHEESIIMEAKEKLREAAEVLPNLGQGISTPQVTGETTAGTEKGGAVQAPAGKHVKEKICDAYGVCKEKVTGLFGKPVKKVEEAAAGVKDAAAGVKHGVEDAASGVKHGVKDAASGVKHGVRDAASGVKHGVEDAASEVTEKARRVKEGAEEATRRAARGVKEGVEDAAAGVTGAARGVKEGVKGAIHGAADKAREAKEGTEGAIRGAVDKAKDDAESAVADKARGFKETAEETKDAVKTNASMMAKDAAEKIQSTGEDLADILTRARSVLSDAASYLASTAYTGASRTLLPAAHLLAFATAYGTCMWVTFVSSHVLAGTLPRQQFGVVQSRLYPAYFRTMAYSIGAALLTYYLSAAAGTGRWKAERGNVFNLLGALGMVLGNMLGLEPRATKVMFDSMRVEKEEGRGFAGTGDDSGGVTVAAATVSPDVSSTPETVRTRPPHAEAEAAATAAATAAAAASAGKSSDVRKVGKLHRKLKNLNSYSSLLNILTLMSLTWHLVHLSRRLMPQEDGKWPC